MGYVLYISAMLWAMNANSMQDGSVQQLIGYLIAALFFVGGAIVFAIKDLPPTTQEPENG